MKIRKTNQIQNLITKLKFLQTKNYYKFNSKFKNVLCKFIKSLKIIYKYNFYNKNILFLNISLTIVNIIKTLTNKNILFNLKTSYNTSHLAILLNTKINWKTKIPIIWIGNVQLKNYDFKASYNTAEKFTLKKNKYLFFFILLHGVFKKI